MIRHDPPAELFRNEVIGTSKEQICKYVARDCDAIVAGLYEYWATYNAVTELNNKLTFIPFPIKPEKNVEIKPVRDGILRIFVGIAPQRSAYKGTDIMLAAAKAIKEKYPDKVQINIAEGIPFKRYKEMMEGSDIILDQLYSYTPAMNSLLAMSKGIINVGGGEPENYDILGEKTLRPIINVQPDFESCFHEIENLVLNPQRITELKHQSIEYVARHHDYIKVAKQYEELYATLL